MSHDTRFSALALITSLGWALPAHAQSANDAAIRHELEAMRAQMQVMAQRIETLEGQLADTRGKAEAAQAAVAAIPAPTVSAKPATDVAWDGAPKLSTKDGWSFKPRGRLQLDAGLVSVKGPLVAGNDVSRERGFASEFRRAYIGFDGTMPGGFGYRIEADIANSSVVVTDVYLTYKPTPKLTLAIGQQKPFWGLDELTSDLFTSFNERAAFTQAFGFERRVGLSASYAGKEVLVQGGVFTDDVSALNSDLDNSYSIDGRVVFMPKLGGGQLHLGGSVHYRDLNDALGTPAVPSVVYSVRPFVHTSDLRLVNTVTGSLAGTRRELGYGLEAAYIAGRFHATAEGYRQQVSRAGFADPTFNGAYAEVGYLLTDDTTAYKGGVYDRIRPKHPVGQGGIGAVQLNARYDWLDLNDAGIVGGSQRTASIGLIWMPTDYVRFLLNYGHLWVRDAVVTADGDSDYGADVVGMRAQFDF